MEVKDMRVRLDVNQGMLKKQVEQFMDGRKQPSGDRLGRLLLLLTMIEVQVDRVEGRINLNHVIKDTRAFIATAYGDSQPDSPDKSQEYAQKIEEAFVSFEELLDG